MVWPDLARLGPFFALRTGAGSGLRPLGNLTVDDTPLRARVAVTHAQLSAGDPDLSERVAASAVQLGLTARLVSPALAGAVLAARVPDLSADRVRWSESDTWAAPFTVSDLRVREVADVDDTVQALLGLVLHGSVSTLVRATLAVVGVAEHILWGNVASALAGAGTVIGSVRPELSEDCRRIVSALVATPLLAGTGGYDPRQFRRTTCCLFYLVPGGGLCHDCVLAPPQSGQA
jgi:ferric iron reductase protein FhuF